MMKRDGRKRDWWSVLFVFKEDRQGLLLVAILFLLGVVAYLGIELWYYKRDYVFSSPGVSYVVDSLPVLSESGGDDVDVEESVSVKLFPFDPNVADSITFRQLGLSRFVTANILKYRSKGGRFYDADDFSRLYGLDASQFERLRPYLRISLPKVRDDFESRVVERKSSLKFDEVTPIDLTTADTSLLRKIPGVGRFYSSEIVRYRRHLGGFYDVNQIKEIVSIPDSVTDYLTLWFYIGSESSIDRLNINRSSIERLRSHPYLDFYKAKAIVEYRRKRGAIVSYDALKLLPVFDGEDWIRFERYFKLEE